MSERDEDLEKFAVDKLGWSIEKVRRMSMRDIESGLRKGGHDYQVIRRAKAAAAAATGAATAVNPTPPVGSISSLAAVSHSSNPASAMSVAAIFESRPTESANPAAVKVKSSKPKDGVPTQHPPALLSSLPLSGPNPPALVPVHSSSPALPASPEDGVGTELVLRTAPPSTAKPANWETSSANTRLKSLATMEEIRERLTAGRAGLQKLLDIRQHMALDADFDEKDVAPFDDCITRAKARVQVDQVALSERLQQFQASLRSNAEKKQRILMLAEVDDTLRREWAPDAQLDIRSRVLSLEKSLGCGFLLEDKTSPT